MAVYNTIIFRAKFPKKGIVDFSADSRKFVFRTFHIQLKNGGQNSRLFSIYIIKNTNLLKSNANDAMYFMK